MKHANQRELEAKASTIKGALELAENLDELDDSECRQLLKFMLNHKQFTDPYTPPADWLLKGEEDPHGTMFARERAQLPFGGVPDDGIANATFLGGDGTIPFVSTIALLTAFKERMRWLSRSLTLTLKLLLIARQRLAKYENVDVTVPVEGDLQRFVETEYTKHVRAIIGK